MDNDIKHEACVERICNLESKYLLCEDGSMLDIFDIQYQFTDSEELHHFYCKTARGTLHTTHSDIYYSDDSGLYYSVM